MKRFTDTAKWRDPWFRKLPPPAKLLWLYIIDNCNPIGVIDLDVDAASFDTGMKIEPEHLEAISSRVQQIPGGKLYIKKFIEFQYRNISSSCPAHREIIRLIDVNGLVKNGQGYDYPTANLALPYDYPSPTLVKPEAPAVKRPPVKQADVPIPDCFAEIPEFVAIWGKWLQHLKEKKKPATLMSQTEQLKKLESIGLVRSLAALKHSIAQNWQGVFEPNNGNSSPVVDRNAGTFNANRGDEASRHQKRLQDARNDETERMRVEAELRKTQQPIQTT